jgi:hypothetical protein
MGTARLGQDLFCRGEDDPYSLTEDCDGRSADVAGAGKCRRRGSRQWFPDVTVVDPRAISEAISVNSAIRRRHEPCRVVPCTRFRRGDELRLPQGRRAEGAEKPLQSNGRKASGLEQAQYNRFL